MDQEPASAGCGDPGPDWIEAYRGKFEPDPGLQAEAIANAIAYAINQPSDVDTTDIVLRPVAYPA